MTTKEHFFIGREQELKKLNALTAKKIPSFVVIKGRRRVGKSRLVQEFAKGANIISITGLPPQKNTTAQLQRDEFLRQLGEQVPFPLFNSQDWGDIFSLLGKYVENQKIVILFDEISWMGSEDPTFLGKLKIAWDIYFSQTPQMILIVCGSVSSWIDKNILASTGFFGRIALKITLDPLFLPEALELLNKVGFKGSNYEKFMLLSMTGCIPWYLELVNPSFPAVENIKQLCFEKDGPLVDEFQLIFHDLFNKRGSIYQRIIISLKAGPKEYDEIANAISYASSGQLSEYLDELVQAGFMSRDYTWSLETGKVGKLNRFRLSDNYLRFYLRCIKPNLQKIKQRKLDGLSLTSFPGFDAIMGLQFENLVLANFRSVMKALNIQLCDVLQDGAFFQRKTLRTVGCQIDYLIHTRQKVLYLCEIKFSQKPISIKVAHEVEEKIKALKVPKGFAVLPILIHVNDVSDSVVDTGFFHRIIDFQDLK